MDLQYNAWPPFFHISGGGGGMPSIPVAFHISLAFKTSRVLVARPVSSLFDPVAAVFGQTIQD